MPGQVDGTADGRAELIALQPVALTRCEEVRGIDRVVASIFKDAPVNIVGSGFGYSINHRTEIPAVFGTEIVGLHAEFLQRVRIGSGVRSIAVMVVVRTAIEDKVGRVAAPAVG